MVPRNHLGLCFVACFSRNSFMARSTINDIVRSSASAIACSASTKDGKTRAVKAVRFSVGCAFFRAISGRVYDVAIISVPKSSYTCVDIVHGVTV